MFVEYLVVLRLRTFTNVLKKYTPGPLSAWLDSVSRCQYRIELLTAAQESSKRFETGDIRVARTAQHLALGQ